MVVTVLAVVAGDGWWWQRWRSRRRTRRRWSEADAWCFILGWWIFSKWIF